MRPRDPFPRAGVSARGRPPSKLGFLCRAWKARWLGQSLEIAVGRALVKPGDLVVDAGSKSGIYLYWLRRFAGPSGTVVAYEPRGDRSRHLRAVCRSFAWDNVQIHRTALSRRTGRNILDVRYSGDFTPAGLAESEPEEEASIPCEVLMDSLDHQLEWGRGLRFLRVDVEGNELGLLKGAVQTLRRDHPVLLLRCGEGRIKEQGHARRDLFLFLQQFGYRGYRLGRGNLRLMPPADAEAEIGDDPGAKPSSAYLFLTDGFPQSLTRYLSHQLR